ncbi:MAG: VOC family protein [Planctomycetota bacterium]|jgi:catechol 2,3-dioxygenase-like lactoylglutathione lyase family enzyme
MAFTGACPNLLVNDLEAAVSWFGEGLGFTELKRMPGPPAGALLAREGTHLLLEQTEADLSERPNHRADPFGIDALFYVDDIPSLHAELRTAGVPMLHGDAALPTTATQFGIKTPENYIIVFASGL